MLSYSERPDGVRAYALTGPRELSAETRWIRRARSSDRRVEVNVAGLTPDKHRWIGPKRAGPLAPRRDTTQTAHFFPTMSMRPIGGQGQVSSHSAACDTLSVRSVAL
jgi:hypothetical protein